MGVYTSGELFVESKIEIESIFELSLEVKKGEHGRLTLRGAIHEETGDRALLPSLENSQIKLYGKEELLFCGLLQQVELVHEGEGFALKLLAVSSTCLLDVEKKSRSFQDNQMTYKEAFLWALKDEPGAGLWMHGKDRTLDKPAYQLEETDWQWIKRMASSLGESSFPGIYAKEPKIHIGLPRGRSRKAQGMGVTETKIWKEEGEVYCQIRTGENWNLGDRVQWRGREYVVGEKRGRLEKGLWLFYYTIAKEEGFKGKPYEHMEWTGRRLGATVLERKGEKIRVQLEMDREQEKDKAYWYPWHPVSGNVFYCMPEEGEKVYIELGDCHGGSERAVEGVRRNGEGNPEMEPFHRLFTTKDKKRMTLSKENIVFQDFKRKDLLMLLLNDLSGIDVRSHEKLVIWAKEDIGIKGETIYLKAPKEISILRKSSLSPSVINMCNGFDSIGQFNEVVAGKEGMEAFPQFTERNTYVREKEEYSLLGMEEGIIASTPMVKRRGQVDKKISGTIVEDMIYE